MQAPHRRRARVLRENGSMYHICPAQCQTHFRFRKKFERRYMRPSQIGNSAPGLCHLADAVLGRLPSMENGQGVAVSHVRLDLGGTQDHGPRLARKTEKSESRSRQKRVHHVSKFVRDDHLPLERAREEVFRRCPPHM